MSEKLSTCVVQHNKHSFFNTRSLYAKNTDDAMAIEFAKNVNPRGNIDDVICMLYSTT